MAAHLAVPTVDLRDLDSDEPSVRRDFVATLGGGFKDFGFVILEGHSVDHELMTGAYRIAERLFALPDETKSVYAGIEGGARGYTPFGVEHAKDRDEPDLKEFWQIGQELLANHPFRREYHDNVWPAEIPEFQRVATILFAQLESCARTVLRALAEFLELPQETFADMIVDGNHVFRVIHYPPVGDAGNSDAMRSAPHEDINMITLLCEATAPGLEILTRDGDWLPVRAGAGQLIVDSGDMLARVVNDAIPATTHRVVNPPGGSNRSRYSMPFFCHPYSDCDLTVMERFAGPGRPAKYPPITAGEYLEERLREIGLKES